MLQAGAFDKICNYIHKQLLLPGTANNAVSIHATAMPEKNVTIHTLQRGKRRVSIELRTRPNAGVMLFYPGTMLSPNQYRPLLDELYAAGFSTAALHLTGHGLNSHFTGFTFNDLHDDGLAAEAWLHEQGLGPVAVCGHSQGGILTLAHAGASQKITAAFPLCGVLPQQPEAISLTHFRPLAAKREQFLHGLRCLARLMPRLPLMLPMYLSPRRITAGARTLVLNKSHTRLSYPLGFLASLFTTELSPKLNCPVYLFNAINDALFTMELARATFDLLKAPRKTFITLPDGGHLAAMNPRLCRFIARTAACACAGAGLPLHIDATEVYGLHKAGKVLPLPALLTRPPHKKPQGKPYGV